MEIKENLNRLILEPLQAAKQSNKKPEYAASYEPAVQIELNSSTKELGYLSLSARQILDKINQAMGIEPEEYEQFEAVDPESTGQFVVGGLKKLFDSLITRVKEEDQQEFIQGFFKQSRLGIDQGYEEAFQILDSIGALKESGVTDRVEQARLSIEQNLTAFETDVYEEYGLEKQKSTTTN